MKQMIALLILATYVIADRKADIECVNNRNKELEGKSDQELFNITQENLKVGQQMVEKRVKTAVDNGFPCYQKMYDIYVGGLVEVLQNGEQERLDKAKTPEERTEAAKLLASITEAMRCDEDWRADNLDNLLKEAKCDRMESFGLLDLAKFKPKLTALETGMVAGKLGLKLKNTVLSGVVGELRDIFHKAYIAGEQCSGSQSSSEQKCDNIKILVNEIDRLFTLFGIQIGAKVSGLFEN